MHDQTSATHRKIGLAKSSSHSNIRVIPAVKFRCPALYPSMSHDSLPSRRLCLYKYFSRFCGRLQEPESSKTSGTQEGTGGLHGCAISSSCGAGTCSSSSGTA